MGAAVGVVLMSSFATAVFPFDFRRKAITLSRSSRSRSCVDVSLAEERAGYEEGIS